MPILFKKCLEELRGKRRIRFVTLKEYQLIEDQSIVEVDEDIGFIVSDFFATLGKYKEDVILIYSAVLDSTQTFLQQYCQDIQNVVCVADVQTQGRGKVGIDTCYCRTKIKCMGFSIRMFNVFL